MAGKDEQTVTGPGGSTPDEQAAIAAAEQAAQDRDPPAASAPAAQPEQKQEQQPPERPRRHGRSNLDEIYKSRREELIEREGINPADLQASDAPDAGEDAESNTDAGAAEPPAEPAAAAPAEPASSPPAAPASGPQAPAAPTAATPKVVDYDPNTLYRVTLPNGQQAVVPGATLLGLAARGQAAARQPQPTPDPAAAPPAAAPATTPATAKADSVDYAEIAKRLVVGSDEEAAEALRQVVEIARAGATAADPETIARKAAEKATEHLRTETALTTFRQEYEDLVKDPYLVNLVANHVQALRHQAVSLGQHKDELTLLREAGNAVIDWGKSRGMQIRDPRETQAPAATVQRPSATQPAAPTSLAERREAKRSAPQPVRPATARPMVTPPPKPRDPSDYVKEQRRLRGQAVA